MNSIFLNDHYTVDEKANLLETVFKGLADLVFVYDLKEHKIVIRNPALDVLLNYNHLSLENVEGASFKSIVHPDDFPLMADAFESINKLKPKDKITVEARIKNTKGTYTYYQTTVSIFKKEGAELEQAVSYTHLTLPTKRIV